MPFTPFHMGVALIVKPVARHHFSLISFGVAQITMDIEPLIGLFRDSDILHGPTHTLLGATLIGLPVVLISPSMCRPILRKYNYEVTTYKLGWLSESIEPSQIAIWSGAYYGTFSHDILDSLIHPDTHPFAPLSAANPWLYLISHEAGYQLCFALGVIGSVVWFMMKWLSVRV